MRWPAQRVTGWGSVYVTEELCGYGSPAVRGWLLRHACDGDFLDGYPPAPVVLAAHAAHLSRQAPTAIRYIDAALLVDHLTTKAPQQCGCTTEQRDEIVRQYLAVLNHPDWCDTTDAIRDRNDDFSTWFVSTVAKRLHPRAFTDPTTRDQ